MAKVVIGEKGGLVSILNSESTISYVQFAGQLSFLADRTVRGG